MPSIRQLPPSVVNKIAAGEVVERPASVVKELVENSLDAGAGRIDVSVEQGGIELVRVVDDGCGIAFDELPLAVASHATSKLATADDLFHVRTLGFRGEALASIAEVSRLLLRSHVRNAGTGGQIEVVGGQGSAVAPCGTAPGTQIEVRNLFFNTPVRRKFLRSTQTEMGHVTEAFTRLALAHPEVHFTLRHQGRTVHDMPPVDDWRTRIALLFGQDLADELLWIESVDDQVRLSGYVARPSQSRSHPRMQYLLLNGRHIRDRALSHALQEAYRGLILSGRYPISFLRLEMPPEMVDVNVHPTKLEVRFQDSGRIYSQLLGTLRTKFLATDLTHRLEPVADAKGPAAAHDPQQADRLRQAMVDWTRRPEEISAEPADVLDAAPPPAPRRLDGGLSAPLTLNRIDRPWPAAPAPARSASAARPTVPAAVETAPVAAAEVSDHRDHHPPPRALQIHNRYLVAESEEGVLVIDQHALHERILYEQLKARVAAGGLESQRLLVPEAVDLSPGEAALVLEQRELLARLGLRVEPFGGGTVLVSSYPAMLARLAPGEVLRQAVDQMLAAGRSPSSEELNDELLHMMACKAAIKAGDPLSSEEIAALLELRHLAQDSHHCPHGRPTALVFTREDLDRQFKRT